MGWAVDKLLEGMVDWIAEALIATLKALWGLLAQTAFTSPDVTALPQVVTISSRSQMIVNAVFVLAVIAAGVTVMTHETVQVRYGVGDLLPRLVIGFVAANFATPICRNLISGANTATGALTGDGVVADGAFEQMQRIVIDALNNDSAAFMLVIVGLIIAVLTGMLLVALIVRLGLLVVLVGIAPIALACHATPFTDPAAKLWWRSMVGVLSTVTLQALAMHTTLTVFLAPDANLADLGIPDDPTGVGNLFIVACLLWVTIRIPSLMRRYVTGGQSSTAGTFLRMMLIQAVSKLARLPSARGGRSGGGRQAAARAADPSVAHTTIAYWRPRLPRKTSPGVPRARGVSEWTSASRTGGTSPTTSPGPSAGSSRNAMATPPPVRTRPIVPPGVNPATAMPQTRPVRPPVTGPWNRPPRPPRPPRRS